MSGGPGMVTILRSRYGGFYEPGEWIAFACWPDDIPPGWNADDVTCAEFFASRREEIGGGATPQEPMQIFSGCSASAAAAPARYGVQCPLWSARDPGADYG